MGDVGAWAELGRCHELGLGTPASPARAVEHYRHAALQGSLRAIEALIRLLSVDRSLELKAGEVEHWQRLLSKDSETQAE
ncbi:MAG: SEL1-like repeat protein [Polyangiaceae bacterium]